MNKCQKKKGQGKKTENIKSGLLSGPAAYHLALPSPGDPLPPEVDIWQKSCTGRDDIQNSISGFALTKTLQLTAKTI